MVAKGQMKRREKEAKGDNKYECWKGLKSKCKKVKNEVEKRAKRRQGKRMVAKQERTKSIECE